MARAGTQRWRNLAPEIDDVQRSIDLLDKVLAEYDEHEVEGEGGGGGGCGGGGGGVGGPATDCSGSTEPSIGLTPDDESPSLGHQSEDDGYMSMNGRKAKMALIALRPVPDCPEPQDLAGAPAPEFPPPPEEAERIISTLLPMVSPGNSSKRSGHRHQPQLQQQQQQPPSGRRNGRQQWIFGMDERGKRPAQAVTTQTTLPKTRHQRPYGWENGACHPRGPEHPFRLAHPPSPPSKFASLPYDGKVSFNWIPPRDSPGADGGRPLDNGAGPLGKRPEACRRAASENGLEDLRQSSEDGLDEEDEPDDEDGGDEDEDEDEDEEEASGRPGPDKPRPVSAHANHHHLHHHHHHHHHHQGSRRPPRQTEITKSSSVEDRLLMNSQPARGLECSGGFRCRGLNNGGLAGGGGDDATACPDREHQRSCSSAGRRRRNNSDSSEGRFSRNSGSERSSMPRSSSASVERFSMRANCDSSDFSRANSTSNERFHSDFSIAVASASSNDHVSAPSSEPFSIRHLDFAPFGLPRADSSERFSAQTDDRCSEERYSEIFSTRNSDFSTRNSTDFRTQSEEEHFSDDSLEELLPPPPALSKRHSIAWDVPLDGDPLYVPGSTKVVGRRRRKSSDVSSVGSASKLRDFDDLYDPRVSTTDDDLISPYSDSSTNDLENLRPQDLTKSGTYVIRRGRKKERKVLPKSPTKSYEGETQNSSRLTEIRRFSNTFDNIKSLLKETSKLEGLREPPLEFANVQAVSQPDLLTSSAQFADCKENELKSDVQQELKPIVPDEEAKEIVTESSPKRDQQQSEDEGEPAKITSFAEQAKECNGTTFTTSRSLDVSKAASLIVDELPARRSMNEHHHRHETMIPVNLPIEDQLVRKPPNEKHRQYEKVNDTGKEVEKPKTGGDLVENRRWRYSDTKLNAPLYKRYGIEGEAVVEQRLLDAGSHDVRPPRKQAPLPPAHSTDATDAAKPTAESDFEHRRLNGRPRAGVVETHKNDTKQIENVIDAILEDSKNPDFQVSVEVLEFPPLPPSPVEEADEESSDVGGSGGCNGTATTNPATGLPGNGGGGGAASSVPRKPQPGHANRTIDYKPRVPPHRGISLDSSREHHTTSLDTRSMDAGHGRRRRIAAGLANARRDVPVERRTLPTDLPGPSSHRRPYTKRHSPSTEACSAGGNNNGGGLGTGMQTSCSLPETPVFARGSDIPRTPQHAAGGNPTQPRRQPGWYAPTTATTGYRRNNPGLEQAIIGTELLRLAGGPNRGWYPTRKSNQPRPASIEHLERLNSAYEARLPGAGEQQRKPLTLPTNITPNKYFGQSKHSSSSSTREALRRVTSLLIKKGGGGKDGKNGKDNLSPSGPYAVVAGVEVASDAPKKKGFFKSFWKRSRHYSLENQ